MDGSLPGSSVRGILQARKLEWVEVPSSKASSQPGDWTHASYPCLLHSQADSLPLAPPGGGSLVSKSCPTLGDPKDCSCQALLSMGFSRQECRSRLPFPSPGNPPNPGTEPGSPALQADSSPTKLQGKPSTTWEVSYLKPGSKLICQVKWLPGIITRYMVHLLKSFGEYFTH